MNRAVPRVGGLRALQAGRPPLLVCATLSISPASNHCGERRRRHAMIGGQPGHGLHNDALIGAASDGRRPPDGWEGQGLENTAATGTATTTPVPRRGSSTHRLAAGRRPCRGSLFLPGFPWRPSPARENLSACSIEVSARGARRIHRGRVIVEALLGTAKQRPVDRYERATKGTTSVQSSKWLDHNLEIARAHVVMRFQWWRQKQPSAPSDQCGSFAAVSLGMVQSRTILLTPR